MNNSRTVLRLLTRFLFSTALIAPLMAIDQANAQKPGSAPSSKIAPWVLEKTANNQQAEFLIVLADQADLRGAEMLTTKEDKGRFVRNVLWEKAQSTQGPLLKWLSDHKVEHRSFYIVNLIWVKGNLDLAQAMAARPDVLRVEGNPEIRNYVRDPLPADNITSQPTMPETIEPGVNYTHAPQVWASGFTARELSSQVLIPAFAGRITRLNPTTAAGMEQRQTTISTGMTPSTTASATRAATTRLSLAMTSSTGPTPLVPRSATMALAIRSEWRRAPSGSVAATWTRATARRPGTSSAWSFSSRLTPSAAFPPKAIRVWLPTLRPTPGVAQHPKAVRLTRSKPPSKLNERLAL